MNIRKRTIKVVFANALMTCGNQGCIALSVATMCLLKELFGQKNIDFQLYLPDSGDLGIQRIEVGKSIIEYIGCSYPGVGIKGILKDIIKGQRKQRLSIFKEADFILDIGQGDSFSDIYGKERFFQIDMIHQLAKKYGIKYCILPQTIGPFNSSEIRKIANDSIKNATLCMVRDKQSQEYVQKYVPLQKHIDEYVDMAFFLPYVKKEFSSNSIHVGINVSGLLWNGGYTKNNQFGLRCDYKDLVRQIIRLFLKEENVIIHLIPHVLHAKRILENDYSVSVDLKEEFCSERLVLAPFFFSPMEAKSYIAGLDFFIGARMHATIAAFSSGVPVVPMAYSRKFNGLFMDTLNYKYMVDMKTDSDKDSLHIVQNAFEQRIELKQIIKSRLDGVVEEKKQQLCQDLTNFLHL